MPHGLQQLVFGKRFGQVFLTADHAAPGLVEHPVLGRKHDHGRIGIARIALDDRAGLVTVELGHQDVAEDQLRLVVVDLGQRVIAVVGEQHFIAALTQKDFGTAPYGVAVVHHQHLQRCVRCRCHLRSSQSNHGTGAPCAQISTISKSSLRAAHSGQVQFMGTSSQRVCAGMPCSGQPSSSWYSQPQIKHIQVLGFVTA
ncbi:hypothetical protein D3C78_1423350 [compost metagenome]